MFEKSNNSPKKRSQSQTSSESPRKKTNSQSSNFESIAMSCLSSDKFQKIMSMSMRQIEEKRCLYPSQEFVVRVAPSELKELVFHELKKKLEVYEYPFGEELEAVKSIFASSFLIEILIFVKRQRNLPNRSIVVQPEENCVLTSQQLQLKLCGKADYMVVKRKTDGTPDKRLICVEVKRNSTYDGVKECVMALKYSYQENKDGHKLFGFCTNGELWRLVTYMEENEKPIINTYEDLLAIIPMMDVDDGTKKNTWMIRCGGTVDVLYSILTLAIESDSANPADVI